MENPRRGTLARRGQAASIERQRTRMHEPDTTRGPPAAQRAAADAPEPFAAPFRTAEPDIAAAPAEWQREPAAERSGAEQAHGAVGQLRRVARALMAQDPFTARAIERIAKRVERLVAASLATPRRGWTRPLGSVGRRLSALLRGGAAFLGTRRRRTAKRASEATTACAPSPPPFETDQSRMPRHDRPSGYFSARNEGSMKNTTGAAKRPRK